MNRYEDDIRERLFVEVYNAEKKRELLKEIPHELRENLAVVYRLSGYDEDTGRDCELVTNEQMKRWGVDAEKLKKDAWENTMAKRPPILVELEDGCDLRFDKNLLEDDIPVPKGLFPELDMFILTNKMGDNGAIYLLDDKTMQRVSEKIGGNLIAMPSSIHESILYAEETGVDALRAREIVHGANSLLSEELFLSDEVYRYDKDAHTLSIIPELTEDMMPDRISIQEMHAYGYLWEGMLPLTRESVGTDGLWTSNLPSGKK